MPFSPSIADLLALTPEEKSALLDMISEHVGPTPRYTVAPNGWITYHPDRDRTDCIELDELDLARVMAHGVRVL